MSPSVLFAAVLLICVIINTGEPRTKFNLSSYYLNAAVGFFSQTDVRWKCVITSVKSDVLAR